MKLLKLKIVTLVVCMTISGCSTRDQDKQPAEVTKVAVPDAAQLQQVWFDEHEQALREAVAGSAFEVERRKEGLVLIAPAASSFNPDREAMLLPVTLMPFSRVAKLAQADPQATVLILGHTDDRGDAENNLRLSLERARSVAAIFRLTGLGRDRLRLEGLGSARPLVDNDSQESRARNQRVEVLIAPRTLLLAEEKGS